MVNLSTFLTGTLLDNDKTGVVKSTIGLSTLCVTAFCNRKAFFILLGSYVFLLMIFFFGIDIPDIFF